MNKTSLLELLAAVQSGTLTPATEPGAPYLDFEMWAFAKRTALLSHRKNLEVTP
jgi:hypothetical protein